MHPVIEMRNITKCFPGVVANQNINLTVMPGEIHALLGENGAGKTTLMNILSGMYRPDSGEILLHGRKVFLKSPFYALKKGVGMIYQHFKLVSSFTVAENVVLGDPRAPIFMRQRKLEKRVREIAGAYGFNLNMSDKVGQLSIGEQQRVEILRALYRKSDVLIMDEPTTVLTPDEVKDLFSILRRMAAQGKAIILITHKLHEVMAVADSVTVLRRGEVVDTIPASQADEGLLARMMVGREADWERHSVEEEAGKPVLEMQAVSVRGDKGNMAIDGLKLDLKSGEILAIAGVAGNGQKELVEAMAGLRPIASGKMLLEKRDVTNRSVRAMTSLGVRLVPEDRLGMGLVGGMGVPDNMILRDYFIPR
ncbi:MAG: ABC transporter ATP-binding protein, partial [Ignavibacteriales bacterium]